MTLKLILSFIALSLIGTFHHEAEASDVCNQAVDRFNAAADRNQALDSLLGGGSRLKDCYLKGQLDLARMRRVSEKQVNDRRNSITDECKRRPETAVNCFENRVTNPIKLLNLLGIIDKSNVTPQSQIGGVRDDRYRSDASQLMICCSFDGHIQAYDLPATNCHGEAINQSRNWCRKTGPAQGISLTTADPSLLNQARQACREEPYRSFRDLCNSEGEPIAVSPRLAPPAASGSTTR